MRNDSARVGNFKVYRDTDGEFDYVVLATADGGWEMSWREDSGPYALWSLMLEDSECAGALEVLATMHYSLASVTVDEEFVNDFFKILGARIDRMVASAQTPTYEEEQEAIQETWMLNELNKVDGQHID